MGTKANLFNESAKKTAKATLGKDMGVINSKSKTSLINKANGTTIMNSGIYAQYKCDKESGVATEISLQSITKTVQRELSTSDLIINRHKLNSQLYEFTNLKANRKTVMGNLTMDATILVKAWEPTLEQFVLIRRPARFPVFGNLLDAYVLDDRLQVEGDFSEDILEYKRNLNDLSDLKDEDSVPEKDEDSVPEKNEDSVPEKNTTPDNEMEDAITEENELKDNVLSDRNLTDEERDDLSDLLDDFAQLI